MVLRLEKMVHRRVVALKFHNLTQATTLAGSDTILQNTKKHQRMEVEICTKAPNACLEHYVHITY